MPAELRERYFERADGRLVFRKDLRRTVIFGRNNLVQDAPISRLDLLVCRNTLMYFNARRRRASCATSISRCATHGELFLGKSEMMLSHRDLFTPATSAAHLRQAAAATIARPRAARSRPATPARAGGDDERARRRGARARAARPPVVSRAGRLTFANLPARALFRLSREDLGRPLADLELPYRPVELRAPIEQACATPPRRVGETTLQARARRRAPARRQRDAAAGAPTTARRRQRRFEDVTPLRGLQDELEGNRRDLELAYEELQSTVEELETTNEELQSANEELQTTNEELQSTNEELETMNEELQSTNEELETINDELRERTGELNHVNEFLEAILTARARRRGARPRPARPGLELARRGPLGPARRGASTTTSSASTSGCRPSSSRPRCGRARRHQRARDARWTPSTAAAARSSARRPCCRCSGRQRRRRAARS